MINTTKEVITSAWLKIADSACTVQSVSDRDTYSSAFFDVVIGELEPAIDTDIFIRVTFNQHVNFHHDAPVWLRLNVISAGNDQPVIVIK